MSTGLNCLIIEPRLGAWYYVLEDCMAPKCAWDWREYATAVGPFLTADAAKQYLSDHEANPGSYSTIAHDEFSLDEVYTKLIEGASVPRLRGTPGSWRWL